MLDYFNRKIAEMVLHLKQLSLSSKHGMCKNTQTVLNVNRIRLKHLPISLKMTFEHKIPYFRGVQTCNESSNGKVSWIEPHFNVSKSKNFCGYFVFYARMEIKHIFSSVIICWCPAGFLRTLALSSLGCEIIPWGRW